MDDVRKNLYDCSALRNYSFSVSETQSEIKISGVVRSWYHKQIAQEIVRTILKSKSSDLFLKNELVVDSK